MRVLALLILIGWLVFLVIAIYQFWINDLPRVGAISEDLRKLGLAMSWGALGSWVTTVLGFMRYLSDVDENDIERSHWNSLITQPLFYPLFGSILAVAIVFLLLGMVTDDVRIAGVSILAGLLFSEIERRISEAKILRP